MSGNHFTLRVAQLDPDLRSTRRVGPAVALRRAPENAAQTFAEFGAPSAETRARVHELWLLRFRARPELREQFEAGVAEGLRGLEPSGGASGK